MDSRENPKCYNEHHIDENLLKQNIPGQENIKSNKWHLIKISRIMGGRGCVHHPQYSKTTMLF